MPMTFYPHVEDTRRGSLREQIDMLMEAAERYRIATQDLSTKPETMIKRISPKDQVAAYNWEAIAAVLRDIREMPEASLDNRIKKAELLNKLAEIYEVLRSAKMSKLEAVRLALIGEANHLQGGT